ncbi:Pre-mRNA-splicing factor cwc26 [Fulvia fulva]|nr:Pre-mRNA-splicing factor cwc26 [Fulvia fulva]
MTLADYLAQNYLSADTTTKSKKRKRKDKTASEGLVIDDEDDSWKQPAKPKGEDDDEDTPTIVGGALSAGLNKPTKKTKWVKIGAEAPKDSEQAAADAILADAAAESRSRAQADDEDPMMLDEDGAEVGGPTMANGAMAGLQSAAQVTKALNKRRKEEMKAMKAANLDSGGLAQQTIYRDASGRMINVKEKKEEAEAQAKTDERKAREEDESRKGDVQRRQKEERRQELQEAKVMTVARSADDEKMNDELKERERWNDPMAQLLATKKSSSKDGKSKGSGKTYQGAFEPNRYGIRPGWRWDGVDRSNGFERKWFAARNKAKDRKELEYAWQLDE